MAFLPLGQGYNIIFTSLPQSLHLGWCHPALAAPADQHLCLAEDLPADRLLGCTSVVRLPA